MPRVRSPERIAARFAVVPAFVLHSGTDLADAKSALFGDARVALQGKSSRLEPTPFAQADGGLAVTAAGTAQSRAYW